MLESGSRRINWEEAARLIYQTREPTVVQVNKVGYKVARGVLKGNVKGKWVELDSVLTFLAVRSEHRRMEKSARPVRSQTAVSASKSAPLNESPSPIKSIPKQEQKEFSQIYRQSVQDYFAAVFRRRYPPGATSFFLIAVWVGQIGVLLLPLIVIGYAYATAVAPPPEQAAIEQWLESELGDYKIVKWFPAESNSQGSGKLRPFREPPSVLPEAADWQPSKYERGEDHEHEFRSAIRDRESHPHGLGGEEIWKVHRLLHIPARPAPDQDSATVRQVRGGRAAREPVAERSRRGDRPEQLGRPLRHPGEIERSRQARSRPALKAGLETRIEENVTCCYAVQDKVWVTDPDGNNWEVYVVLDNEAQQHASNQSIVLLGDSVCHAGRGARRLRGGAGSLSCGRRHDSLLLSGRSGKMNGQRNAMTANPATEMIWSQLSDDLRRFIRRRVADEHVADDLLQETFLRIHRNVNKLKSPTAWRRGSTGSLET
jgi:hypothetical protein